VNDTGATPPFPGALPPFPGALPPFPGAVAVSHLRVYDTEAPDGLRGGTPHVHSVCSEAYAVVAGRGAVQTLSPAGFREVPLEPGSFVWFTPGTLHRLVNHDGALEILVLMQNAGLPEAGDMVICFPSDVLADPVAYAEAAGLPEGARTTAGSGAAARRRRDLGVEGFGELRAAFERQGRPALEAFYARAAELLAPSVPGWRRLWEQGPLASARATGQQLDALAARDVSHLLEASVHRLPPPPEERRMGCCGVLGIYLPDATATATARSGS
jgi:mannose-6-phosphate isomerase-like protein (cupin superfamily)